MDKAVEKAYNSRAKNILVNISDLSYWPKYWPREGEWIVLGCMPNVGTKLLLWMVQKGMLERRKRYNSPISDWYRIPGPEPDLGDLWVP